MSVPVLLDLYTLVLRELAVRDVIRSTNNPVGDYAEYLVRENFGSPAKTKVMFKTHTV